MSMKNHMILKIWTTVDFVQELVKIALYYFTLQYIN